MRRVHRVLVWLQGVARETSVRRHQRARGQQSGLNRRTNAFTAFRIGKPGSIADDEHAACDQGPHAGAPRVIRVTAPRNF